MRTRIFFVAATLLLSSFSAFSQREETVLGRRNLGFSGIWGGWKHQMTQLGENNVYNYGGFFGLEFGKSLLVGFGAYHLDDRFTSGPLQERQFDLRWRVLKLGYSFQPYKAVHPIINLDAGRGRVKIAGEGDDQVYVIQPSAGVELNIFRWFHLGIEGGYRFVTDTNYPNVTDKDLSGAFAQATLKFGFSWGRYRKERDRDEWRRND